MTERRGPDLPNKILDAAGRSQALEHSRLRRLYLPFHALIHGSDSADYLKVPYEKVSEVVDENGHSINLPIAEADPSPDMLSFILQGRKKEAVVVGAGQAAINAILENNPGSQAAVAFTYGRKQITRAGILPNGVEDYGEFIHEDEEKYIAKLRAGGSPFGVGVVVWVPKEKVVITPKNKIIAEHVPIIELPKRYPGALV
jgi:hypothetical protein